MYFDICKVAKCGIFQCAYVNVHADCVCNAIDLQQSYGYSSFQIDSRIGEIVRDDMSHGLLFTFRWKYGIIICVTSVVSTGLPFSESVAQYLYRMAEVGQEQKAMLWQICVEKYLLLSRYRLSQAISVDIDYTRSNCGQAFSSDIVSV